MQLNLAAEIVLLVYRHAFTWASDSCPHKNWEAGTRANAQAKFAGSREQLLRGFYNADPLHLHAQTRIQEITKGGVLLRRNAALGEADGERGH